MIVVTNIGWLGKPSIVVGALGEANVVNTCRSRIAAIMYDIFSTQRREIALINYCDPAKQVLQHIFAYS